MNRKLEDYMNQHSTTLPQVLQWLERETFLKTNSYRMLSGDVVGRLLSTFSTMLCPKRVLEIGTFTGYSAICLAQGLAPDGRVDTLESNDELESLIKEAFEKANLQDRISLILGDALVTLESLKDNCYDLVYIDGNKREYIEYYNRVLPMVKSGGYIIADNVLWDEKVLGEHHDQQSIQIAAFNNMVKEDHRTENFILPLRDGLNIIKKL